MREPVRCIRIRGAQKDAERKDQGCCAEESSYKRHIWPRSLSTSHVGFLSLSAVVITTQALALRSPSLTSLPGPGQPAPQRRLSLAICVVDEWPGPLRRNCDV